MATRKRTHFTDEQKKALESAFETGLTSLSASNSVQIEGLAKRIDYSIQVVKVSF